MEAADIGGATFEEVDKCHSSAEGENLLHDIGVETVNLDPPLYFVPWILLDEVNPGNEHARDAYITRSKGQGWRSRPPNALSDECWGTFFSYLSHYLGSLVICISFLMSLGKTFLKKVKLQERLPIFRAGSRPTSRLP